MVPWAKLDMACLKNHISYFGGKKWQVLPLKGERLAPILIFQAEAKENYLFNKKRGLI